MSMQRVAVAILAAQRMLKEYILLARRGKSALQGKEFILARECFPGPEVSNSNKREAYVGNEFLSELRRWFGRRRRGAEVPQMFLFNSQRDSKGY
jgi:hypothetical protein